MSGILRLENLNKGTTLKQGDKTVLSYRLSDADGEKLNIAGNTAVARLMHPDFTRIGYESEALTVSEDNIVQFSIDSIIPSRLYYLEITVDGQYIFPSRSDEGKLSIDRSSMGAEITIIENAGIDTVVRKAVDLINEDPSLIIDEDKLISEIIANTPVGNIEEYYQQFNNVITELSEEKDYHSLPEISGARGGFDTLGERLDDTTAQLAQKVDKGNVSVSDINKNLGKLDQTYMSDEFIGQFVENTQPINTTPANGSVTTAKLADNSVEIQKTDFINTGKNLFNFDARLEGYTLDPSGNNYADSSYDATEFIPVTAGLTYTLNKPRMVFFYDSERELIGSKIDNPNHSELPVTAPEGASYLRASVYYSFSPTFQVEIGTSETDFEPYELSVNKLKVKKENISNKAIRTNHIADNSVASYQTKFIKHGKNLFNPEESSGGFLQETSGVLIDNASFITSGFIPVVAGETYTINSLRKFVNYDLNSVYLNGINQTQAPYTFMAEEDGYIRFSYSKDLVTDVQMEKGGSVTAFEPYGFTIPSLKQEAYGANINEFAGKSLYSFGDSIMKGAGNNDVGLRDLIAQKYDMFGSNYSVSGASVAYYSDRSHIVAQIEEAIADGIIPDYLIMNGGINDVTFKSLGEVSADYNYESKGYATFSAGLEYCFGLLKTTFPDVPLVYVWVHNMPSRIASDQKEHHDRAVEICKKWSVPIVDMYESGGMNTHIPVHLQQFTYYPTENSGTHPNLSGYEKFYVPAVVSELKRVAQWNQTVR